jgi:hypothetical protein
MHKFSRHQVQLLRYLKGGYLRRTMDVPTAQEKSEQIFFAQPKAHQNKFANLCKMVPNNPIKMITFFEQCQSTDKAAGVLEKIAKDKQPKEKRTAQLPVVRSHELSYCQHCSRKYRNYHRSNRCNHNDRQSDYHHQDNQCHNCP